VPLGETSAAPPAPQIAVEEKAVTIRWKPSPDARAGAEPAAEGLLPSRSLVAGPPPTTYEVYEVRKDSPAGAVPWPTPITPQPVGALEFTHGDITLGEERCFIVRPVDVLSGLHVRGPASPVACDSFADRFAPAPPGRLDAVAATGGINLIWEPSASSDVAGYLVLRGEGANATLTPLTPEPIPKTAHTDTTAAPGVLYTYAVVAVDKAGNRSPESNRVEETGRQ
jgi:fibronectin type 3 domain-containing protein